MSDTVLIHIHRKRQLRACMIPYDVCINGQSIGRIKNGESLTVQMPYADAYLIADNAMPFEGCIAFSQRGKNELFIEMITAGGWRQDTYPVFTAPCEDAGGAMLPLMPAFVDIHHAYLKRLPTDRLTPAQKTLLSCYEFWICFSDDGALGEAAAQENIVEMLSALREIGAVKLADFCEKAFADVLGDVTLPLADIEAYEDRLSELDGYLSKNTRYDAGGRMLVGIQVFTDELRQCAAQFLLDK